MTIFQASIFQESIFQASIFQDDDLPGVDLPGVDLPALVMGAILGLYDLPTIPNDGLPMAFETAAVYQHLGAFWTPLTRHFDPSRPRGWKCPFRRNWTASRDAVDASRPPSGNVAVLTGITFDVIDFDSREAVDSFCAALGIWGENGPDYAELARYYHVVWTPRGAHVYTVPTGLKSASNLHVHFGYADFECDVRAAGACAIAAGSINPVDLIEYRWASRWTSLCTRPLRALSPAMLQAFKMAAPSGAVDSTSEVKAAPDGALLCGGSRAESPGNVAASPASTGFVWPGGRRDIELPAPAVDTEKRVTRWIECARWLQPLRDALQGERNNTLRRVALNAFAHAHPFRAALETAWNLAFDCAIGVGLTRGETLACLKKQLEYARKAHPAGEALPDRPYNR